MLSLCNRNKLVPTNLSSEGLAILVSETGVEKKTVVEVMFEHDLIDDVLMKQYLSYDIAQALRDLTDHALSTDEYIGKIGKEAAKAWEGKRQTQLSRAAVLL